MIDTHARQPRTLVPYSPQERPLGQTRTRVLEDSYQPNLGSPSHLMTPKGRLRVGAVLINVCLYGLPAVSAAAGVAFQHPVAGITGGLLAGAVIGALTMRVYLDDFAMGAFRGLLIGGLATAAGGFFGFPGALVALGVGATLGATL